MPLYWKWAEKRGGRVILKLRGNHRHRRYGSSFCCTCHVVSSWNSNNGDYFTPISPWGWHYHLHGWASPWQINGLWARVLGSPGRKQIHFILSAAPPSPDHPPGFLCAHTCVKLKLSWPYIWLRMLFLWLKRFICWSISGDTLSRFAGGGVASTMATRCCHMYRRWCQLTETATEPTQIGVCMRVGASTQTCL